MKFWWVNHKQTFRQEFDGGYVWCPKRKSNGAKNHFYETLREIQIGDMVFSYANAAVQGFGIADTYCYSCPRPDEFGRIGESWDRGGWRADVEFKRFPTPFRTANHTTEIAPYLPKKYSPIRADGFGNQGAYFSEISESFAHLILEKADPIIFSKLTSSTVEESFSELGDGISVISDWEDRQQKAIENTNDIPETTRLALIQARRGQGLFRRNISQNEHSRRGTKVYNPAHLIASHIKPWRESNNEERLSAENGLLLTPSIDHLFDRGFISFEDLGEVIISPVADRASLKKMGVDIDNLPKTQSFNVDQRHFLDYHRKEILLVSGA